MDGTSSGTVSKDLEDSRRIDSGIDVADLAVHVTSNDNRASESSELSAQNDLPSDFRLGENHLRLVKIHMDGNEDEIRCETRIFNIHEIKHYIALSYAWGETLSADKSTSIILNGSRRPLSWNLWYFLSHAR